MNENHWNDHYRYIFENACLKKKGNEFQDFFSNLMERRYPGDFIRVRPWGSYGDRKNDGFLKSQGLLCQVYAPRELESSEAAKKIEDDFDGAMKHWDDDTNAWAFVHNGYDGLGPNGTKTILQLQTQHPEIDIQVWSPTRLEQVARELSEPDIVALLNISPPTSRDMLQVGFEDIKGVIEYIAQSRPPINQDINPVSEGKIERNLLSADVKRFLELGAQKSSLVRDYFSKWTDPELGDKIAETFRAEYTRLKAEGNTPDGIFWQLVIFAGGSVRASSAKHEAAVLAVISYLFERCDIFEPVMEGDQ